MIVRNENSILGPAAKICQQKLQQHTNKLIFQSQNCLFDLIIIVQNLASPKWRGKIVKQFNYCISPLPYIQREHHAESYRIIPS